jgi:hypothetical protein
MFDGLSGFPIRFGKTKPEVRSPRNSLRRAATSGEMSTNLTEFYDGKPSYTVSIMEFTGVKVARETQYFADPFPAGHYPPGSS